MLFRYSDIEIFQALASQYLNILISHIPQVTNLTFTLRVFARNRILSLEDRHIHRPF